MHCRRENVHCAMTCLKMSSQDPSAGISPTVLYNPRSVQTIRTRIVLTINEERIWIITAGFSETFWWVMTIIHWGAEISAQKTYTCVNIIVTLNFAIADVITSISATVRKSDTYLLKYARTGTSIAAPTQTPSTTPSTMTTTSPATCADLHVHYSIYQWIDIRLLHELFTVLSWTRPTCTTPWKLSFVAALC